MVKTPNFLARMECLSRNPPLAVHQNQEKLQCLQSIQKINQSVLVSQKRNERTHEDLEEDQNADPLGSAEEVRHLIAQALPGVDWSDPTWGIILVTNFPLSSIPARKIQLN